MLFEVTERNAGQLMVEIARLKKELADAQAKLNQMKSDDPQSDDLSDTHKTFEILLPHDEDSRDRDAVRFMHLMDRLSKGVVFQDTSGKIIRHNKAAEGILGLTGDQLTGRTSVDPQWRAIRQDGSDFPGDDHPAMVALRTGRPVDDVVMGILHPGNRRYSWILVNATPIMHQGESRPYEVFSTFLDITERINAKNELSKFQSISDHAGYGAFGTDDSGQIQYVNHAMENMFGRKGTELIGQHFSLLFSAGNLTLIDSSIEILKTHGMLKGKEITCCRKDGTKFPGLITATVVYNELHEANYISATLIDLTRQRQQEETINAQKVKLLAIVQSMPDKIFEHDREGNFLAAHTSYPDGLIVPVNKLVGRNLTDIFSKEVAELNIRSIRECLERDTLVTHEYNYLIKGEIRYYEVRTVPLNKDSALRFVRDITDKKIRENEIRKLNVAIEQSPAMIVITDTAGNFEYISPAFSKVTGYTWKDVAGKHTRILNSGHNSRKIYEDLWSTIGRGKSWHGELLNKKKNGELYWEKVVITPITDETGVVTNYMAITEDNTERRLIEQEIHDLNSSLEKKVRERTAELEASNRQLMAETEERKRIEQALRVKTEELEKFFTVSIEMLCITGQDGTFLKVNRAFEDVLGFPASYFENRKFTEFLHPDDKDVANNLMMVMAEENRFLGYVNRYKHANGEYRSIEWHVVRVEDKLYAAARDITERIRFEETLGKNIAREKELNELKSRFVSIASHEFKTPLATILMASETLSNYWKRLDEEKLQTKLKTIINQVKHLSEIVSNVLQVSKIQEGRITLVPKEIEMVGFIRKAMEPFNADSKLENKIGFESEFDHLDMFLDSQLMMQVMNNLLSNAIKYAKPDPRVHVRLYRQDTNIVMSVEDNGIGIPANDINKMFEPFFRAGNVANIEGNGLGLNIVKEAITLHGGKITVESEQGKGTTFYVELPDSLVIKG